MFILALSLLYDAVLAFVAMFSKKHEDIVTSTWPCNAAQGMPVSDHTY
jgi:hypothetical protein